MADVEDIRKTDPGFNEYQHCTNPDCLTFSHTAHYCEQPQPRRCGCPFDYPPVEEVHQRVMSDLRDDILHALRTDHSHTTAQESTVCRTCTRRADLMVETVEKWIRWHEIALPN